MQFGFFTQLNRSVSGCQAGFATGNSFFDEGQSYLGFITHLCRHPATEGHRGIGQAFRLVLGHDECWVELFITRRNRLGKRQGSQCEVNLIVEVAGELPGADDDLRAQPVAHLDAQFVRIHHNVPAAQAIQARGAITLNFIFAETLRGLAGESAIAKDIAFVFGLDAVEGAAVAPKFSNRKAGIEIAKQCVELRLFNLQIQLAYAGGVKLRLRGVGIQGVKLIRVDGLFERFAAGIGCALGGVVGHGHQVFALDLAFAIKRNSVLIQKAVFNGGFIQAHHVAAQPLESNRALGKTH